MKCILCENQLKTSRGWATETSKGKLACQLPNCKSSEINPRSKEFQIIVMGKTPEEVELSWKLRAQKSVHTAKVRGNFEDKSKNPFSVEYWIKKGLTEDEAKLKIRSKNHNCEEYWVTKGFDESNSKYLASESAATNALRGKIKKYGEVEGLTRYLQTKQKMSLSWTSASTTGQRFGSSKQANDFFRKIYRVVRRLGYKRNDVMCSSNMGEFYIRTNANIFFYDFCIKPLKLIIEFNGEHVHPNVEKLNEEQLGAWTHAFSKKSAKEVIEQEQLKHQAATEKGYNILYIWSKDDDKLLTATNYLKENHDKYHCTKTKCEAEPHTNGRIYTE